MWDQEVEVHIGGRTPHGGRWCNHAREVRAASQLQPETSKEVVQVLCRNRIAALEALRCVAGDQAFRADYCPMGHGHDSVLEASDGL